MNSLTERARWWWGTAPSEIRGESTKQYSRQTLVFLGGRCSRISWWTPEARSRICICRASFLMTFVQSGMRLVPLRCGSAREPKRPGEVPTQERKENALFFFRFLFVLFLLIVVGLCCCSGFSVVAQVGATLCCGVWASHCSGFFC